ncbi:hypothetical protein DFH07DRAFT_328482 [Mycena maculata]|uniref:Uncharacterized protein n=1 Tax=Mycena maculata TaxID=230809 RepID=A0AAD7NMF0_9AGAR|nr:hypothetical protein DFH07DRAFT_328482 [Mycena maculata]
MISEEELVDHSKGKARRGQGAATRQKMEPIEVQHGVVGPHTQSKNKGKQKAQDLEDMIRFDGEDAELSELSARDKKNAERRAARHRRALEHPEEAQQQRMDSGQERGPMVAAVWAKEYARVAKRERAIQDAIKGDHADPSSHLKAIVSAYCDAEGHTPIPATAPAWDCISPRTCHLLLAITKEPTTWDPQPFVENGTLVLSKRGDKPTQGACVNYVRKIPTPTPIQDLTTYLCSFPADAGNTTLQLLMQGETPTRIRSTFGKAMESFGLNEAVGTFMDAVIDHPCTAGLLHTHAANPKSSVFYAGITGTVAPADRCFDDVEAGSHVRIVNYLSIEQDWVCETYHLVDIDTPFDNPLHVRTSPTVSHLERIVRACGGAMAMNSAHGGLQPLLLPSSQHLELLNHIRSIQPQDPYPLGEERDHVLAKQICKLLDAEVDFFGPLHHVQIMPAALRQVKGKVADVVRRLKGRVVLVELTKDIPEEGILGCCGGYWDATVGLGPKEDRHLRRILHPEIPAVGNLSVEIVARYMGPFLDFWRITLSHLLYWLHVLFLSRLLGVLCPLVTVTQSSPVTATLRSHDLMECWNFLSEEEADQFMNGNTLDLLYHFPTHTSNQRFCKGQFNTILGLISLVRTGREPNHISLHVARGDPG